VILISGFRKKSLKRGCGMKASAVTVTQLGGKKESFITSDISAEAGFGTS
jgi:hypothetical protein